MSELVNEERKVMSVADITEAPWNVNVMDPEIFDQLVHDLKTNDNYDPVHVAKVTLVTGEQAVFTVDGAQRLRAAKKLGWKEMAVIFHHTITTEDQARLFNYRRDVERGSIDQFKLAESFQWFVSQGKTHEQIAKDFQVDRTTVTKRIGLLKVDPQVRKYALEKQGLSISHLEPLMTLEPELQKQVIVEAVNRSRYDGTTSVTQVDQSAKWVLKDQENRKKFQQVLDKAKFTKCPKCKGPPRFQQYSDYQKNQFECGNYHRWDAMTGKDPYAEQHKFNPRTGTHEPSFHNMSR